jgi:hypothetical protein
MNGVSAIRYERFKYVSSHHQNQAKINNFRLAWLHIGDVGL